MTTEISIKGAKRILREETNFLRDGLQLTKAAENAVEKAFQIYAEQFIDAAIKIASLSEGNPNIPARLAELKDFL